MTQESSPNENVCPEVRPATPKKSRLLILLGVFSVTALGAMNPTPVKAAWAEFERIISSKSEPLPASPNRLSDHDIESLSSMSPQQQAQLLMERSINHYDGAIELIEVKVPAWYGHVQVKHGPLANLLNTAINANDLHVRAAALEITLAGYDLPKTRHSVDDLLQRLEDEPEHRAWLFWMLGVLGNRGVETARLEAIFLDHLHDSDETVRTAAVNGLGFLATDGSIAPLLSTFREDPSPHVREAAASAIAQSGMFREEQRIGAIPGLLKMMDDATLDTTTRTWVFQSLQDITGANLGSNPAAWHSWWAQHSRR